MTARPEAAQPPRCWRDRRTAEQRNSETARQRDSETARQRDSETARASGCAGFGGRPPPHGGMAHPSGRHPVFTRVVAHPCATWAIPPCDDGLRAVRGLCLRRAVAGRDWCDVCVTLPVGWSGADGWDRRNGHRDSARDDQPQGRGEERRRCDARVGWIIIAGESTAHGRQATYRQLLNSAPRSLLGHRQAEKRTQRCRKGRRRAGGWTQVAQGCATALSKDRTSSRRVGHPPA